jgi:hypothetical protein
VLQGGEEEEPEEYVEGRHGNWKIEGESTVDPHFALVSEEGRRGYHCIYMAKVDCM